MPNLGRAWGASSWPACRCKSACYIAIASCPSPAAPNPNSKIQNPTGRFEFGFGILDFGFWILDFGFWILDFGFWISDFGFWISLVFLLFVAAPNGAVWILDFGFWILDQFSLPSFCGGPKRRRLDFGFRILDSGFWILEFGFWILDFGLSDTVWILHKIFPCHADSGRRISASAFRPFILFFFFKATQVPLASDHAWSPQLSLPAALLVTTTGRSWCTRCTAEWDAAAVFSCQV